MKSLVLPVFLCSCLTLCVQTHVAAQIHQDSSKMVQLVGLRLHRGFVLIHSRGLVPIKHSYPLGLEFDLAWHKTSEKAWKSCDCYPMVGLTNAIWNYDQPKILGYGFTSMLFLEPVFGARKKLSFSLRAAIGLGYFTKPYHADQNPLNLSYSTHINFSTQFTTKLRYRLRPNWYLDINALYNHISNSGVREPNKGINWPTAAFGVHHYLKQPEFTKRAKSHWREDRLPEKRMDITLFTALNEPARKLFLLSPGIELKYSQQVSWLSALTIGLEAIYDQEARYEIKLNDRTETPEKIGTAIGHEFLLGKFVFSQQIGVYVYRPYRVRDDVYHRHNLIYRITKKVSLGVGIKVHKAVANFLDFRAGYSFGLR